MNKVSEAWDPTSSSILSSAGSAFINTPPHRFGSFHPEIELRAHETITSHFRFPPSGHLGPIFTRKIHNVGLATPAALLPQVDPIFPKSGREFWEVIISRILQYVSQEALAQICLPVSHQYCRLVGIGAW